MATPSETFTEMVTFTLRNTGSRVADNVSNHNMLLRTLKRKGKIKKLDGGYEIQEPLEYAENSTPQRYSGYQELDISASDVFTSAKFDWRQMAMNVVSSGKELRMNNGSSAMKNLAKHKVSNAQKTAANFLSTDIYSDGSLDEQIGGLANIIQTNGQGTVGGINSATHTFWRNQFREATGTNTAAAPSAANSAQFKADMNALFLSTLRGSDSTDLIVMTHDFFTLYELGEQQLQRYADADTAHSGFNHLKYKSAIVVPDDNANFGTTDEKAYFLNTDYLYLVEHSLADWKPEKAKTPVNQDAIVIPLLWMGNMVVTNRARQGILFDAA